MYFDAFSKLDQLLVQHRHLWQFQPMQGDWPALPPTLLAKLQALSLTECAAIDADPVLQQAHFGQLLPEIFAVLAAALQKVPRYQGEIKPQPFWLSTDIPGRKWQQICLFASATAIADVAVLEWCAGKGHLGRLVAFDQQRPVHSLEWQQNLCDAGQLKADKLGLPQHFSCVDVLTEPTLHYFEPSQQWLALHACGDLHRVGLRQAMVSQCQAIGLLPCCYHLQQASHYQAFSAPALASSLQLDKAALRLAVQQSCTGGERVRRLSHTEMLWRQLWRLWALQQGRSYQPLKSVGKQWFSGALVDFLQFAGAQHQLPLPNAQETAQLLTAAEQALLTQRQLEVLQHLFRRPLELWLVLDMALAFEAEGYQVNVQQLCDDTLTPRNLLLQAWRGIAAVQDT